MTRVSSFEMCSKVQLCKMYTMVLHVILPTVAGKSSVLLPDCFNQVPKLILDEKDLKHLDLF